MLSPGRLLLRTVALSGCRTTNRQYAETLTSFKTKTSDSREKSQNNRPPVQNPNKRSYVWKQADFSHFLQIGLNAQRRTDIDEWISNLSNLSEDQVIESFGELKKIALIGDGDFNSTFNGIDVQQFMTILTTLHKNDVLNSEPMKDICRELLGGRRFSSLGFIAQFAKEQKISWLQLEVIDKIAELIPNIGSVTGSDDVHTAYVYMAMDLLSQETCTILNARFKVIMSKVETKTLVKILHIHAVMKKRNMDVISMMIYNMGRQAHPLTVTQLTNLYYASSFLSLLNRPMLTLLRSQTAVVLQVMGPPGSKEQSSILNMILSMGKMKWNDPTSLTNLCNYISDMKGLTTQQYSSVLTTCAVIGCFPAPVKEALLPQLQASRGDLKQIDDYLNIVWCMLRFNLKSEPVLRHLLSEDNILAIVKEKPPHLRTATYSKLLNIATAAQLEYGIEIPTLLTNIEKDKPKLNMSKYHCQLAESLVSCLRCDAAHIERGVWFPTGHIIDFRYLFETDTNIVVSPQKYIAPDSIDTEGKSPTPPHLKWVAVLANSYLDTTVSLERSPTPEGRRELAATQLKSLGYHVININGNQFMNVHKETEREQMLRKTLGLKDDRTGTEI